MKTTQIPECDALKEALRPFARFAEHAVKEIEYGDQKVPAWASKASADSVSTWFAAADFLRAYHALDPPDDDPGDLALMEAR